MLEGIDESMRCYVFTNNPSIGKRNFNFLPGDRLTLVVPGLRLPCNWWLMFFAKSESSFAKEISLRSALLGALRNSLRSLCSVLMCSGTGNVIFHAG